MPSKFNIQINACAPFDAGHPTHYLLIDVQASNRGNTVTSKIGGYRSRLKLSDFDHGRNS